MRTIFLLVVATLLSWQAYAQTPHICATDSLWKLDSTYQQNNAAFAAELAEFRAKPPATYSYLPYQSGDTSQTQTVIPGCKEVVYIIPVVVHIDESGSTVNTTDSQVHQQIEVLNTSFEDYGIRFVLAKKRPNGTAFSGINRFSSSFDYRFQNLAAAYASSSTHYYDPEKYFNIYVTPQILSSTGAASTISGFNQRFPDMPQGADLVVVQYTKFGDYNNCSGCGTLNTNSRGLVLVHEAGHYLGLRELWQGGCAESNTAATCATKGDLCCDTRPVNANYSCPTPSGNDCGYHLTIGDNHENYMDYTGEDCQTNFTNDQVSLMRASLELYRNTLISPQNLNNLDLDDCFASAWFNADVNFLCNNGIFTLRAINYTGVISYRWQIMQDTITLLDTTLSTDTLSWFTSTVGNYDVSLEIIYGTNDSSRVTRFNYLQVADCFNTIASEQGNWYFGEYAGIRFTSGGAFRDINPSFFAPNNINTAEGSISHSDSSGQLLFYGGGTIANLGYMELYNSNYLRMPNSPILGDFSSVQAGAVVPMPGDTNQYYVFSISGSDAQSLIGFRYSVIDMTLDGGLGDVDTNRKDVPIFGPAGTEKAPLDSSLVVSEQITVIPKCADEEYWILVINGFNNNPSTGLYIQVYNLDSTGISHHSTMASPIISSGSISDIKAQLKASPNGNWLFCWDKLIRFNKSTGIATFYKDIGTKSFGASFSPNSKLLYVNETVSSTSTNIYQFDLQSSNDSLSKTLIVEYPNEYISMQLGPDEQVYISKFNQTSLGVIAEPDSNITNVLPNACEYSFNGPVLANGGVGGTCILGLPNMRDAKTADNIPLDFVMIDSACGTVTFLPSTPCAGSYKWNFGDGDSSSVQEPTHTYADTGLYIVTLTINGTTVKQKELFIGIRSKIEGDSIACVLDGNMVNYSISNRNDEFTYTWSATNGAGTVTPQNNFLVLWDSTGSGSVSLGIVNPSNGCTATEVLNITVNVLDSNIITPDTGLCFSGQPLTLFGNVTTSSIGTVNYYWQNSVSGQTWDSTGVADTLQNLSGTLEDTTLLYRRIARSGDCIFASNELRIAPVYIAKNLINTPFCPGTSLDTVKFPLLLEYDPTYTVTVQQHHYKASTLQWDTSSTVSYPNDFPTLFSNGDSVKIKITRVGCGSTFSNTVSLTQPKPDQYGTHNEIYCTVIEVMNDLSNVAYGTDTFFYVKLDSSIAWLQEAENGDSFFKWQRYNPQNATWEDIPNSSNDTLFLTIDYCTEATYRANVRLGLKYSSDCIWVASCYEPDKNIVLKTDLWSRDGVNDTAAEPNSHTANDYWNSPDLWNCWDDTTCSSGNHESPEYKQFGWNLAKTTVRNKGSIASGPFDVKLYWTLGGFFEQWPLSWHYDTINNGYYDSNTMQRYPMGAEIGTVSSTGIGVSSTFEATHQWAPPYPGWYTQTPYFDSSRIAHPLCMLSRIVTCVDTPFGMTYPEVVPTGYNIINNNNIVTRNTEVYDSIGTNKKTPEWVLRIGNQWSEERKIKLVIDNTVNNFWDLGYYVVQLDPNIHTAWVSGGSAGSGYTLTGSTFYVYGDGFYLDSIDLDSSEWGWVHFQFRLHDTTQMPNDRGTQMFSFVQHSSQIGSATYEPDGGFNFLLNLEADANYVPPHIDSLDFTISPNPTSQTNLALAITTNFSTATSVLNIYDNLGNAVIPQISLGALVEGTQGKLIDITGVSSGLYSVVITANGVNYSESLVVN